MKKTLLILSLGFTVFFTTQGNSQTYESQEVSYLNNALKINPVVLGRAEFNLSYERFFSNRKSSISISPSIYLKDNLTQSINGWQIAAQYRFYLTHFNKQNQRIFLGMENFGFYSGLYISTQDYKEEFQKGHWDNDTQEYSMADYNKEITSFEGGAMIGIQIDITKRIVIDFNVGGGVRYTDYFNTFEDLGLEDYVSEYSVFDPEYQGVKPKVQLLLGITF